MVIAAQFFRYLVVGVMNVALDFFLFNLLSISLDIYSGPAIIAINSLAGSVVLVHSFFWNKFWAFRKPGGNMLREFAKFVLVNLGSIALNSGIVFAVTTYLPPFSGFSPLAWENTAKLAALGVNVLWNFTGFRWLVFYQLPGALRREEQGW